MSMVPSGMPSVGQPATYFFQPVEIWYGNQQFGEYIPLPIVIDGIYSSNPQNLPYNWYLYPGTFLGKETSSNLYRNSIIGLTTANVNGTAVTSITTSTNVTSAVNSLITLAGGTVQLTLTGVAAATGTNTPYATNVASATFVATAASAGTIATQSFNGSALAGALIQPADGSQTIRTIMTDVFGNKIIDMLNTTAVDVYDAYCWNGGGMANVGALQGGIYTGLDPSIQVYIKTSIKNFSSDCHFSDDF